MDKNKNIVLFFANLLYAIVLWYRIIIELEVIPIPNGCDSNESVNLWLEKNMDYISHRDRTLCFVRVFRFVPIRVPTVLGIGIGTKSI